MLSPSATAPQDTASFEPGAAPPAETIAVIDFETTGMAGQGARATEIAAVLVSGGQIVGQYQSLMRSGAWVPPFIEQLTGISNAMLADAPPADQVMHEVLAFTRGCPLVAHNAPFDRSFWRAESALAGAPEDPAHEEFACTLLLSRRLYPDAPNHKLGGLAEHHALPREGRAHRALSDALLTAHLLLRIQSDVLARHPGPVLPTEADHGLLRRLQRLPRRRMERCLPADWR
ncbi:3'-5' exonuclease [Ideonella azotifigens]|uniref:3'-5' exonuclease n=2 Tax=Ideonella azotifigens TaxID=513160 RepID=A0ABN1KEJ8_9BURK|nr:3'-5' exonuclease [Ideonella azotifigens]